jgi:hypothetical protein
MDRNKFQIGDLVRWEPDSYDRQNGDTEDTGIVIEIGDTTKATSRPLRRYALIKWIEIGPARIICEDSSWEKTHIIARANNV